MESTSPRFAAVNLEDKEVSHGEVRQPPSLFYYKTALGLCAALAILFLILFAVYAANSPSQVNPRQIAATGPCLSPECVDTAARVLAALNQSVSPCEDFYEYACGGWREANPVPDDKPAWGSFTWLSEKNQVTERKLLSSNISTETGAKASRLFMACLNEDVIDARGNTPVLSLYHAVNSTFTSRETGWDRETDGVPLSEMIATLQLQGVGAFFGTGVGPDDKNSSQNAMFVSQGGLSLPDRDYYFKNASTDRVLLAFQHYIATAFELMGVNNQEATLIAERVVKFEISLAEFTLPPDELRDPVKLYNPRTVATMNTEWPNIKWTNYFARLYKNIPEQHTVTDTVVATPNFFVKLSPLVASTPKSTLIEYMQAHVLMSFSSVLSQPFRDNRFRFRKTLYGIQTNPDRWKTCVGTADSLGFAVGEAFVQDEFSKLARASAEDILKDVTKAFADSFEGLSWMDPPTRVGARLKASKITQKIGYPLWFDTPGGVDAYYKGLGPIDAEHFFEGVATITEWQSLKSYSELFKPVDRTKWEMNPQEVNAYYHPSYNEIVFPAGILQPPFFSMSAPKALNYGGIGAVMGHEISHAFDDQGAQYDGDGNLKQWWSTQSYDRFQTQTSCIANQYSKFTVDGPIGPVQINGNLTLGENIADNGGVRAAFTAYRSWVAKNGAESKLPGLDAEPEKLFFLGYAHAWCQNARPDYAKLVALADPHSPPRYRVNAVVMNSKEFAAAYKCPVGSKMNPLEKCAVW